MDNYREFLSEVDKEAYHAGEFKWQEDGCNVTRTYHYSPPGCHNSCGVLLYERDGILEKVEGDPLSPFVNGKLCIRCLNIVEAVYSEKRIKYPMRRAGERGENKWQRISWEEALDEVEQKVKEVWRDHGPESIFLCHGTGRNVNWQMGYFGQAALKTPNISTTFFTGFACYIPRVIGTFGKVGDFVLADAAPTHADRYANPDWRAPEVLVVWGNEPLKSNGDGFIGHWLVQCVQRGTKIISIDPRLTWWGARAEYWLPVRPGTDSALALAMQRVIIEEDLYDHDFVDCWCYGFDELKSRVEQYDLDWAAQTCGLSLEDIQGAARLYAAGRNSAIQWGLAFDQQLAAMTLVNSVVNLMCLTGNIDVPGGNVLVRDAFEINGNTGMSERYLPEGVLEKKLINRAIAGAKVALCPQADSDRQLLAMETGDPYPIKMVWIESTNAISCAGMDAPRALEALRKVPYIVVADPYITPTASAVADLLLPVAMSPERDSVRAWWTPVRTMSKAIEFFEAKSDEWIMVEVGKRLNPQAWQFADGKAWANWYLTDENKEGGTKFPGDIEHLEKECLGYAYDPWGESYRKFEKGLLRPDGTPGFNTPTGRCELKSIAYETWGLDPLPFFIDAPTGPATTPELMEEYPLVITTGGRSWEFFHSENREQQTMRELHPVPKLTINPKDAERYGVKDGQWIWVENAHGRMKQQAYLFCGIKEGVVHAEHGWWYPESEPSAPYLYGTFESNPNNLTQAEIVGQGGVGSPIKSMICKVYPVAAGEPVPA
jgi:anaerobic selenocysteine-containing dehydrogenase